MTVFLKSVLAGLVANGGTSTAQGVLRMIVLRRNKRGFVDAVSSRLESSLSNSGKRRLRKWIDNSDSACWASEDSLAECLREEAGEKAVPVASALWSELLQTQLTPHDQILLSAATDAAEGGALAADGIAEIHSRLGLGRSSLNGFPSDALDLPHPEFFPAEWETARSEVVQAQGDMRIEAAAGTSVLRFLLHLEHAVFVSRISPTLIDDLNGEAPAFVVLWKPTDGLVDEVRLIRQQNTSLSFRIVAVERGLLKVDGSYRLPSVSRATLTPVLTTLLTDLNSVDAVLRAAPGRPDLALGLAAELSEEVATSSGRADWIFGWFSDYFRSLQWPVEVEAALALIAVLGEVAEQELTVVAELCGITLPALESAILEAEHREILARRSILGADLQQRTFIKVAFPGLSDGYLQGHWRDHRFGLPTSIDELVDAFPDRAGTIFETTSNAAVRGLHVRSADVDFVFGKIAGSSIDLQSALHLLASIAPQSSAVAAVAIRRADELVEQNGGLSQASSNVLKIGAAGAAYNLREGWDLLVRSLSSGHRLSDEDRQGLEELLHHPNPNAMRAAAIRSVAARLTDDGSAPLTCGLIELAIETEWSRFARDISDDSAFRVSRQTISAEALAAIKDPLFALAEHATNTCETECAEPLLNWASSMASFSTHDHSGCCGWEIPSDVIAEAKAIAVRLLAIAASIDDDSPSIAQRHNNIAEMVDAPLVSNSSSPNCIICPTALSYGFRVPTTRRHSSIIRKPSNCLRLIDARPSNV